MIEEAACAEATFYAFEDPSEPEIGLSYCATCPVRSWCLREVRPATSNFDGVAGGHVWKNGEHIGGSREDGILLDYMREAGKKLPERAYRAIRQRKPKAPPKPKPNYTAVRFLLNGHILWEDVELVDRQLAAAHLIGDGWTEEDAKRFCGL